MNLGHAAVGRGATTNAGERTASSTVVLGKLVTHIKNKARPIFLSLY